MAIRYLRHIAMKELRGRRVILRVDFNEPIREGKLLSDERIREALPTIRYLLHAGSTIIVISHLGRPRGKRVTSLSLRLVARRLAKLLRRKVMFVPDPFRYRPHFDDTGKSNSPRLMFIENIRFWRDEERNDPFFAKTLASFGDYYINDAFSNSHRNHASMSGIPKYLPHAGGFLLEKELRSLERVFRHHKRPFFVILGGGKVSTKINLVKKFLHEADGVLLGGALANAALAARGLEIGKSTADHEIFFRPLKGVSDRKLYLPIDVVVVRTLTSRTGVVKRVDEIQKGESVVDVGAETARFFGKVLHRAKTIVWNGPMGISEREEFSQGTINLIRAMRRIRAYKVTGGGDTIAFLRTHHFTKVFDHVSSGGGAMLEFLLGKKLPGIEALRK